MCSRFGHLLPAPLMHIAPPVPVIPPLGLPAPDNNNAIDHEWPTPSNYERSNEGEKTTEASPNNEEASASAAANNTTPNAPSRDDESTPTRRLNFSSATPDETAPAPPNNIVNAIQPIDVIATIHQNNEGITTLAQEHEPTTRTSPCHRNRRNEEQPPPTKSPICLRAGHFPRNVQPPPTRAVPYLPDNYEEVHSEANKFEKPPKFNAKMGRNATVACAITNIYPKNQIKKSTLMTTTNV